MTKRFQQHNILTICSLTPLLVYIVALSVLTNVLGVPLYDISLFDFRDGFSAASAAKVLIVICGIFIASFCPGTLWNYALLKRSVSLLEFLAGSFALNLALLIAATTFGKLAGFYISRKLLIAIVCLHALIGVGFLYLRPKHARFDPGLQGTIRLILTGAFAILIMLFLFQRQIFTSYDDYWIIESSQAIDYQAFDSNGITKEYRNWRQTRDGPLRPVSQDPAIIYHNWSTSSRPMNIRFLMNYYEKELRVYHDGQLIQKYTNPQFMIDYHRPGHQARIRNKMIISSNIYLTPGPNIITLNLKGDLRRISLCDTSNLSKDETVRHLKECFIVGRFPEVSDANETLQISDRLASGAFPFEYGRYSMLNPPLLHYYYNFILTLLDSSVTSIYLAELWGFLGIFLLMCAIVSLGKGGYNFMSVAMILVVILSYVWMSVSLPLMHTASGIFLLLFLVYSYLLFSNRFELAVVFATLTTLVRYEGIVLVLICVASHWMVVRRGREILRFLSLFVVITTVVYGAIFLGLWFGESLDLWWEAISERAVLVSVGEVNGASVAQRFLEYSGWALVGSCFLPCSFLFLDKGDKLARFYLFITIFYFGFIVTLSSIRLYYLGPLVLTGTIVGVRSISDMGRKQRIIAFNAFLVLAGLSMYLVQDHLRGYVEAGSRGEIVFISEN